MSHTRDFHEIDVDKAYDLLPSSIRWESNKRQEPPFGGRTIFVDAVDFASAKQSNPGDMVLINRDFPDNDQYIEPPRYSTFEYIEAGIIGADVPIGQSLTYEATPPKVELIPVF